MWASIFRMIAIAESFTRLRFPCRGARKLRIPRIENHGILYHSPKTVCKTTGSYVEISGTSLRRNCLEDKVGRLPDHFIVSAITPVGCFGSIPYLSIAPPVYASENISLSILAWEESLRSHSSDCMQDVRAVGMGALCAQALAQRFHPEARLSIVQKLGDLLSRTVRFDRGH
jgi:hypothetical protein